MSQTLNHKKVFGTLLLMVALLGSSSVLNFGKLYAAPAKSNLQQTAPASVINVNKAGLEELQAIRGVGPALAERIVQYRTEHGRFERIEDLTNVRGIGEAKFQKIKAQVSI